MKIYIAHEWSYDEHEILGVFSTMEKALKFMGIEESPADPTYWSKIIDHWHGRNIEEWKVDENEIVTHSGITSG